MAADRVGPVKTFRRLIQKRELQRGVTEQETGNSGKTRGDVEKMRRGLFEDRYTGGKPLVRRDDPKTSYLRQNPKPTTSDRTPRTQDVDGTQRVTNREGLLLTTGLLRLVVRHSTTDLDGSGGIQSISLMGRCSGSKDLEKEDSVVGRGQYRLESKVVRDNVLTVSSFPRLEWSS